MNRFIEIYFCDFSEHVDLSFLKERSVILEKTLRGDPTPNNKTFPYNVSIIRLSSVALPDEYDERIEALIGTVGGEDIVKDLVSKYRARISDIVLGIPCKTSEWNEEGYISSAVLLKVAKLGLGVQFYYT